MKITITMNKIYQTLLIGVLMMPMVAFSQIEGPAGRAAWERRITQDPKTGIVPLQELEKGRNQVEQFYKAAKKSKTAVAIPNVNWKERGPSNVGGRTRAMMWDPQNGTFTPKRKKVWAGGVSGGLWTNNDITDANSSWIKVAPSQLWDNIAISSLAYDPTNKQILYAATGERGQQDATSNTGSSGSGGGGIWKSIDGGNNWNRLASTIPDYTLIFSFDDVPNKATNEADSIKVGWREIYKVLVTPTGTALALTRGGILKSEDKGITWNRLKGTNAPSTFIPGFSFTSISDMELGNGGILYVAEGTPNSSPRILKSTDGTYTNFQLCPLPNNNYANGRVEIALTTQNNNQTIYAVSAASSKPDYRFFLKSVDGGANWTNMTTATYKEDGTNEAGQKITQVPFFNTQGFWGLILGTHNTKPDVLYAGGVSFDMSFNGGNSWMDEVKNSPWTVMSDVMHADHHAFEANPDNNDEALFGNDGGVYYSNSWSSPSTTLAGLNIQKRNKDYNVTQYFAVDLHPVANNGLVVGGTQDNGTHAISSNYNTVGNGLSINGGDGALTFIDQIDPNIVISSYIHIQSSLHKNGATSTKSDLLPHSNNRGQFINPADYDSPSHTYYANFTYDSKPVVTATTTDTLAIRYKITTSTVPEDNGYTYTPSYLTYPVSTSIQPIKVSFMKLGKITDATSNRVLYLGTPDGDVYKTNAFGINGNQSVTLTKIMDKATTSVGNVSSIDFGSDENTIIVTKSNYNIKSIFYATNANAGTGTTWISKDETIHGLPNIPIRYALINPKNLKEVLLATDLGVWSTTDITATNPDWKETNEALARVRCDMLKYRISDATVIVGTHGRGIFSAQLIGPAILTSIISGNWESPATWNLNRLPTATDDVVIDANHTVTVTTPDANAKKVETRSNGKVIFNDNTTKLKLGF
jgi:hypothetical protein